MRPVARAKIDSVYDVEERLGEAKAAKTTEEEKLSQLKLQWGKEKGIITRIRDLRTQLESHAVAKSKAASGGDGAAKAAKAAGF